MVAKHDAILTGVNVAIFCVRHHKFNKWMIHEVHILMIQYAWSYSWCSPAGIESDTATLQKMYRTGRMFKEAKKVLRCIHVKNSSRSLLLEKFKSSCCQGGSSHNLPGLYPPISVYQSQQRQHAHSGMIIRASSDSNRSLWIRGFSDPPSTIWSQTKHLAPGPHV
jgi:hypothetical protein